MRNFFNKRGFTIVEVAVSVAIMALITLAIMDIYITSTRTNQTISDRLAMEGEARKMMQNFEKEVRNAGQAADGSPAVTLAADNNFIFYSDVNGDLVNDKIRYYLLGTVLKKEVTIASGTSYSGAVTVFDSVHNVTSTSGLVHVFSYVSSTTPTSTMNASDVRMVALNLSLYKVSRTPISFTLQTKATIRALQASFAAAGGCVYQAGSSNVASGGSVAGNPNLNPLTVSPGESAQVVGTFSGGNEGDVIWSVSDPSSGFPGVTGGDAAHGYIGLYGDYTAPASAPTNTVNFAKVWAVSKYNSSYRGFAYVNIGAGNKLTSQTVQAPSPWSGVSTTIDFRGGTRVALIETQNFGANVSTSLASVTTTNAYTLKFRMQAGTRYQAIAQLTSLNNLSGVTFDLKTGLTGTSTNGGVGTMTHVVGTSKYDVTLQGTFISTTGTVRFLSNATPDTSFGTGCDSIYVEDVWLLAPQSSVTGVTITGPSTVPAKNPTPAPGNQIQLVATTTPPGATVTWSVSGGDAPGAGNGSIDQNGLYTAPMFPTKNPITITATANGISATKIITITPGQLRILSYNYSDSTTPPDYWEPFHLWGDPANDRVYLAAGCDGGRRMTVLKTAVNPDGTVNPSVLGAWTGDFPLSDGGNCDKVNIIEGNLAYIADWCMQGIDVVNLSSLATVNDYRDPTYFNSVISIAKSGRYLYAVRLGTDLDDFTVVDVGADGLMSSSTPVVGHLNMGHSGSTQVLANGNYAYVTDKDGLGFSVIKIVNGVPTYKGFVSAPGVVRMDISNNRLYVPTTDGKLTIFDISGTNSDNPALFNSNYILGSVTDSDLINAVAVSVYGNYAYVSLAWDYGGLIVVDVTNPASPAVLMGSSVLDVGSYRLAHSLVVQANGKYVYVGTNESHGSDPPTSAFLILGY